MILVDTNLLLYAYLPADPRQREAAVWLEHQVNSDVRIGLPWTVLLGFVRLAANPRIFAKTVPVATSWSHVLSWLALENVWVPEATERHAEVLGRMLGAAGESHKLVTDAHLAALAIEHGLTLCSADRDFARFPELRWVNPLG